MRLWTMALIGWASASSIAVRIAYRRGMREGVREILRHPSMFGRRQAA